MTAQKVFASLTSFYLTHILHILHLSIVSADINIDENMLGWINDCIEKLVVEKFDREVWHIVKQKAGCSVRDGDFSKLEHYSDKSTLDLVAAASEVSGLTVDQILETFGGYFVHYVRAEGYDNLLCCQGSTLKDWASNINAIHEHLQATFPTKMIMPQFWCEDGENGSLLLHYYSKRGSMLSPLAKGLVTEIAAFQFDVKIDMDQIHTQGRNGATFTTWVVTASDPSEMWKLTQSEGMRDGKKNAPTALKCPFTGLRAPPTRKESSTSLNKMAVQSDSSLYKGEDNMTGTTVKVTASSSTSTGTITSDDSFTEMGGLGIGLSATVTKKLFPYHIIMDEAFQIVQVGQDLAQVLKCSDDELIGMDIADVLEITKPKSVSSWDWNWLRRLEDQSFNVEPVLHNTQHLCLSFKTSVVLISDFPTQAMLIMAPDAGNLEALMEMNLTLSDLPVHGEYRDAVFLREHLSSQMNSTLKMEKLSKSLAREKELLESLLPQHAAEGLRAGKTVEPMLHKHTTFFFSDVVGFTTICKNLYPWEVIGMLNRLYCVMDFLALRFNLFKVETIGDAFVAASGLPQPDENHAENVANFAVAVQHCCRQVLSPLEKEPIRLRVGIHTGPCASGIVGTTNPRYCVFGDTVNTTARHESSGEPGKIHCSRVTKEELERRANDKFSLAERGLVEMKGKGEQLTYWLTGSESNKLVNGPALEKLDLEVKRLLETTNFDIEAQKERARKSLGVLSQMDGEQTLEAFIEKEVTRRSESVIEATLREASQRDSTDRLSQHEEADTRIKKSAVRDLDLCPKRSEVCESFECRCRIL